MSLLASLLTRSDDRLDFKREHNLDLFLRCYGLFGTLSVGVGAAIIAGGAARFSSSSFRGPTLLLDWLPFFGAHVYWGLMFLALGVSVALSVRRARALHILRYGVFMYMLMAVMFGYSALVEPTAAALIAVVFLGFAGLALLLQDHLSEFGWEG